jgi:hypothetical protein
MLTQRSAGRLLKGVYSAAVAVLGALAAILTGSVSFSDLTDSQIVAVVFAGVVAFGGTFGLSTWPGPTAGKLAKPESDG